MGASGSRRRRRALTPPTNRVDRQYRRARRKVRRFFRRVFHRGN